VSGATGREIGWRSGQARLTEGWRCQADAGPASGAATGERPRGPSPKSSATALFGGGIGTMIGRRPHRAARQARPSARRVHRRPPRRHRRLPADA